MSDIKSPQDSLNSYFDDLLGTGEPAVQPAVTKLAAGAARVVAMPQKNTPSKTILEAKKLNLVPAPEPRFSEPEHQQTEAQKQKLEKLLQSARTHLLAEPTTETKTETTAQVMPEEIQEWDVEALTQLEAATEPTEIAYAEPLVETPAVVETPMVVETTGHSQVYYIEGLEWLENGRPQWAQSRFDVLLFGVSGLTLAVPLVSLGQIQLMTDELTPLFGQADWFMGLLPTPAGKIRTVNTAKFVMPERYDENFVKTAKYVVSINGVPWGLAVDSVNQPISLHPDDVKWRSDRSKRPWLAGTVKEHMCALLDIPRIGQLLIEADKNAMRRR